MGECPGNLVRGSGRVAVINSVLLDREPRSGILSLGFLAGDRELPFQLGLCDLGCVFDRGESLFGVRYRDLR